MANISTSVCVNYTATEMYELVNDIEAYPSYVPMCSAVKLISKTPTRLKAALTLAKGKIKLSFTTENTMEAGRGIQMTLVEGPFKQLRGVWRFEPLASGGCETTFRLDYEFANALLGVAFGGFLKEVAGSMVQAFCDQAARKYGERPKIPAQRR
ncbi:type II toxin-antitoxin system RatA family toxin [Methylomagnum ishizawai]|uniref:type II toxin-antitoxin system RatA family toxin n=1 Tax=Methylomagnum ishizawai TaxID=1760988 RepID=UPI001C330CB8|nr:type II toxin-antitoxin system RatA family toxin [Methylomagnum ishizawai]BBL76974.1 ubiquinone-binding protein [Methylomagnum ishizawai]